MTRPVMRAVTYTGGRLQLSEVPRPALLTATDAVVKISTSAICGSDLHIRNGRLPGVRDGSVVGHEFVGHVVELGTEVTGLGEGDRVIGSCMIPCGSCVACKRDDFGRCPTHAVLGYGVYTGDLDGAQAEYVRIPNASLALKKVFGAAAELDDTVLLPVGDVLTTGLNVAQEGRISLGDTVVVHGLGPVGLYAVQAAALDSPARIFAVDPLAARRTQAERFGAIGLDPRTTDVAQAVRDRTGGVGADVALECAGALPALEQALATLRPGGRLSVIGLYTEMQWSTALAVHFARGLEIKFCGTANIIGLWDQGLKLVESGQLNTAMSMIERLPLERAIDGYEAVATGRALKVLLTP